jgi:hypothetical protein
MTNKTKYNGGPKSTETKAISSRNSITHGLTARQWINNNEQFLFDESVKEFIVDHDPQSYTEKILINTMATCLVRLMRIQNTENAMFELAISEAGHPEKSLISLNSSNDELTQAVYDASYASWKFSPDSFTKKIHLLNEIDRQNLSDISGWNYVEDNMPMIADYIIKKCTYEQLKIIDFISRETDQSGNIKITIVGVRADGQKERISPPIVEITKDAHKIPSPSLQKYFDKLAHNLAKDLQVQDILKDLEQRTQQIKDAALPDIQKLNLVQRYRTADERLFSKSLGELIALQDRRKITS